MVGIEKSLEVFDDLEKIAVECIKMAKHGLGIGILIKILDLLKVAGELIMDAKASIPELADLSPDESGQLAARAFVMVKSIIMAVKA